MKKGVEFHQQFNRIGDASSSEGGATFLLRRQTIRQSSYKVVPADTSMVCEADKIKSCTGDP